MVVPPTPLHIALLVLGGLLVVAGARLYPVALAAPGAIGGVALALALIPPEAPAVRLLVAGLGAAVGAIVARVIERMALRAVGALAGASAAVFALSLIPVPAPLDAAPSWAWPLVGTLVGGMIFPAVVDRLLWLLTPLVGALCLDVALGLHHDPRAVGALWVAGALVQAVTMRRRRDDG